MSELLNRLVATGIKVPLGSLDFQMLLIGKGLVSEETRWDSCIQEE
jgi:hypothetical protein